MKEVIVTLKLSFTKEYLKTCAPVIFEMIDKDLDNTLDRFFRGKSRFGAEELRYSELNDESQHELQNHLNNLLANRYLVKKLPGYDLKFKAITCKIIEASAGTHNIRLVLETTPITILQMFGTFLTYVESDSELFLKVYEDVKVLNLTKVDFEGYGFYKYVKS